MHLHACLSVCAYVWSRCESFSQLTTEPKLERRGGKPMWGVLVPVSEASSASLTSVATHLLLPSLPVCLSEHHAVLQEGAQAHNEKVESCARLYPTGLLSICQRKSKYVICCTLLTYYSVSLTCFGSNNTAGGCCCYWFLKMLDCRMVEHWLFCAFCAEYYYLVVYTFIKESSFINLII